MQRKNLKNLLQMGQFRAFLLLTLLVALLLALFIGYNIHLVNQDIAATSFKHLSDTAGQLAKEFEERSQMDRMVLQTMARIIATTEDPDTGDLLNIINAYDLSDSYISYVEILRPDSRMLDAEGTIRDVSASLDFATQVSRGIHISNIETSTKDAGQKVVRNAVPVIRDGQPIYLLYGVVNLGDLVQKYRTDIYDGQAYVYLLDGNSGDFLLDTWHQTLGNIRDFSQRTMLPGYTFEAAISNMAKGLGGRLGFVSRTTGNILYLGYEPVAINNWSVVVSVEQHHAFLESHTLRTTLYRMTAVIGVVLLLYMITVLHQLFKAYQRIKKLGMEDQTTLLPNRNAYDKFLLDMQQVTFPSLVCIYIDANNLHGLNNAFGHAAGDQMLRTVADVLRQQFPKNDLFRVGGDEFVVYCRNGDFKACSEGIEHVSKVLSASAYSISYGIIHRQDETGIQRITQEADQLMLENKRIYYTMNDRRKG